MQRLKVCQSLVRFVFLAIILLFMPWSRVRAWTGPALDEAMYGLNNTASNCSTFAFPHALTAGEAAIGGVFWNDGTNTLNSVTRAGDGTYTIVDTNINNGASSSGSFYIPSVTTTTAATPVVANFSGTVAHCIMVVQIVSGVGALDKHAINATQISSAGTGTNNIVSPLENTTVNGEYIFGAGFSRSGATLSAGTGFTWDGAQATQPNMPAGEYAIQSTAGSITVQFTNTATDQWHTLIMTFQPAGGGSSSRRGWSLMQ